MNRLAHSRALVLLVLVGACVPVAAQSFDRATPETLGLSSERLARLDAALAAYVDNEQYAGSVTLVLRDGQIAFFEAYGDRDRESQSPMQPDTIFRIASQSKAVVSTAAMAKFILRGEVIE